MKYIYIDSLFLLSLFTDYLLCLVTGRFCGLYLRRWRYLVAAIFGAVYSVCVFLPGLSFLALPVMELASAAVMGLIAFGGEKRLLRCIGVFLAVSATFGGLVWALTLHAGEMPRLDLRLLFICFALCYLALSIFARAKLNHAEGNIVHVQLKMGERVAKFRALVDTGNCLTDPVSGAGVMVVSPAVLVTLFPHSRDVLECPDAVELMERAGRSDELAGKLRLLPYTNISGAGLLPVFRPDELRVEGKIRQGVLVGISAHAAADGFDAVIP
jgi:stage II sporulation protein GA (sporulation sigma-E factor processing peptidase)